MWWNQFDCNSAPSLFGNNANIYDNTQSGQGSQGGSAQGGQGINNDFAGATGPSAAAGVGPSGPYPAPGRPGTASGSFGGKLKIFHKIQFLPLAKNLIINYFISLQVKELHQPTTDHHLKVLPLVISHQARLDLQETIQQARPEVLAVILQAQLLSIHRPQDPTQAPAVMFQTCHQQVINPLNRALTPLKLMLPTRPQAPPERPHHATTCHPDEDKNED